MVYDLIIVGGGPAGMSAGLYAVRYGLSTLVLEKNAISGQISLTGMVENYPGIPDIGGMELMDRFISHAKDTGVDIKTAQILSVGAFEDRFVLGSDNGTFECLSLIIATGANPRVLGVPGEEEFTGRGVSYCATCDGPFFSGKDVVVIGGGDSALTDALILSDIAANVRIVHRRDELRGSQVLQERVFEKKNIDVIFNTVVEEIVGNKVVEKVILRDVVSADMQELVTNGVFIYVGVKPGTDIFNVEKDNYGFIRTGPDMMTSTKGIFAAGDCRTTPLRQVVTAVGDGAIAAHSAYEFVKRIM